MLALRRAGRSSEALEQFRVHEARLDAELGLRPGTELTDLQGAILRHEPGLAAWPRTPGWTGAEEVPTPAAPAVPAPTPAPGPGRIFVGRTSETGILDRMLDEVRSGATRRVVLTGPAGIGKTRLAEECDARTAAIGGNTVWARCLEDDGAPAWWPIRRILRELGADVDTTLIPPTGVESDEARFAVYERILGVVETAATQTPVLTIVLDDIQWADPTSLRCLLYLVGALHKRGVWFVCTLRDSETTPGVRRFVDAVLHGEGNRHIDVPALAEPEVAALAGHVSGAPLDADEARLLAERTGGNPLFVSEYARLPRDERLDGGIPMAVRSVLARRLAAMEPAVLQVLRVAAVAGAPDTGFDHVMLDWNPNGHDPEILYGAPHFDMHFYTTDADREVDPAAPDFAERAARLPEPEYVPQGYIPTTRTARREHGAVHGHALDGRRRRRDPRSFEFTEVLLNGSWDGEFIFIEPMMTREWLATKPSLQEVVKQPSSYQRTGYYPTVYTVDFDEQAGEYVVALSGLTMREAS